VANASRATSTTWDGNESVAVVAVVVVVVVVVVSIRFHWIGWH